MIGASLFRDNVKKMNSFTSGETSDGGGDIEANVREGEAIQIPKTKTLQLMSMDGDGGVVVSHHARRVSNWDFPDAEETKDVVDAEGVEVLSHLRKALAPPSIIVLGHLVPIVGREAPVLTIFRELIRGSTSGHGHVEKI